MKTKNTSSWRYRPAVAEDAAGCVVLRGRTRENAVSAERLARAGITVQSWGDDIAAGRLPGHVCTLDGELIGYCFGDRLTGEVVVLALLPRFENLGIGKHLLSLVVNDLRSFGHTRLFLGCSRDPSSRSFGFYRHLGWRSTGVVDGNDDEVLELT
ncbi:MAG TPA: GNAT family N-acetyltransferase [Rubrivivax sp.]|nr:GNAT family N-acetyltransferase [Rubrivivax sp.]